MPGAQRIAQLSCIAALGLGACTRTPEPQLAQRSEPPIEEPQPEPHAKRKPLPADVVERAALPFMGMRVQGRQPLTSQMLIDALARADVICVGERHDSAHDHYAELALLSGLSERSEMSGRQLGLGLEMFERQFQSVLGRYQQRKLDEAALLTKSEYEQRWGWDFAYYRPLLTLSVERGVTLVATNADRKLVHKVAEAGLDELSRAERRQLPEVDLEDPDHRALFDKKMKHHPDTGAQPDNLYAAQVVWDEAMADAAAKWLSESFPARQLLMAAGVAHCQYPAIPARTRRRLRGAKVVSVVPYLASAGEPDELEQYDYALVLGEDVM